MTQAGLDGAASIVRRLSLVDQDGGAMPWYPTAADAADLIEPSTLPEGIQIRGPVEIEEADVPQANELDTWQWDQYQLESDAAAKLGLTVGGRADLAHKARVLVAEFSRSRNVTRSEGQCRFGVAARLVVKVSKFSADANMTLPFIAAEAQFNRLEASAALRVEGYVGNAAKQFPNFGAFDVETYVKLMDALTALKNSIGDDEGNIRPVRLWIWADSKEDEAAVDDKLTNAVGTVWALTGVADGKTAAHALANYRDSDDEVAKAAIRETYGYLTHGAEVDAAPAELARTRARELLDGYRAKTSWFY